MDCQPHQQRVVQEKSELDEKANALSKFIGENPIFDGLPPEEQERLKVQNDLMWQYSEILGLRISAFRQLEVYAKVRDLLERRAVAEQKIGELLHENGGLKQQTEQFKTVYREFNNLLCHIGYEGSVDADSRYVWDAMQALKAVDGGVYGKQFAAKKVYRKEGLAAPDLEDSDENPAYFCECADCANGFECRFKPEQRKQVPMTKEQINNLVTQCKNPDVRFNGVWVDHFALAGLVEAHHKITEQGGNT